MKGKLTRLYKKIYLLWLRPVELRFGIVWFLVATVAPFLEKRNMAEYNKNVCINIHYSEK